MFETMTGLLADEDEPAGTADAPYQEVLDESLQDEYVLEGYSGDITRMELDLVDDSYSGRAFGQLSERDEGGELTEYTVSHCGTYEEAREAIEETASCITAGGELTTPYHEGMVDDPYTELFRLEEDGEMQGYMRTFLLDEEDREEYTMAVDIIRYPGEPEAVTGWNTDGKGDMRQSATLAAAVMAQEADLSLVVDPKLHYKGTQACGRGEAITYEKPGRRPTKKEDYTGEDEVIGFRFREQAEDKEVVRLVE